MMTASGNPPRRWMRHAVLVALLAALTVPMTGCGKKGPLDPPAGSEDTSTYPRQYPTQ